MKNKIDKICHYSGLPSLATYKNDYVYENEIEIAVTCIFCESHFVLIGELINGQFSKAKYCTNCTKQSLINYEIINNEVVNLKISTPSIRNEQK